MKKFAKRFWMMALVAMGMSAALLSGCVATPMPPMDQRVTIAEDLGTSIYVTDVRCAKGKSPFYTFQANVVNNASHEMAVEWKVVWLDADGMALDSISTTWDRVGIAAKGIKALKAVAPATDAVDMRFYVRRKR